MDSRWVKNRKAENLRKANHVLDDSMHCVKNYPNLPEPFRKNLLEYMQRCVKDGKRFYSMDVMSIFFDYAKNKKMDIELYHRIETLTAKIKLPAYFDLLEINKDIDSYQDTSIAFNGDIVITDPCYLMKNQNDWENCDYGNHMEVLGITQYETRDTLYGDWLCKVQDKRFNDVGRFCAESGLVTVANLDEILKYNPDFFSSCGKECYTVIRNFNGTVKFIVNMKRKKRTFDSAFWQEGEEYEDFILHLECRGKNNKTDETVFLTTKQAV